MRFSTTMEGLGVNLIDSVMTLIAFLPVLAALSANVTELPLVGAIPYPLVVAAVVWSLFGTVFLALVGIKLPGLEFRNQRVEAAYRKELVYGEDDASRAQPPTVAELFANVRQNYFRLYFHYMYFNVARISTCRPTTSSPIVMLAPTIVAGKITLGVYAPDPQCVRARCASRSSIWSIPGRRSWSCSRSTSACAPSRRRSKARRCRTSTVDSWSTRKPTRPRRPDRLAGGAINSPLPTAFAGKTPGMVGRPFAFWAFAPSPPPKFR